MFRYPYAIAAGLLLLLTVLNLASGAFTTQAPEGFTSRLELIGRLLMFTLITPYLFLGWVVGHQYSLTLANSLEGNLADLLEQRSTSVMLAGSIFGLLFGYYFNLAPTQVTLALEFNSIALVSVFGNLLTWTMVGLCLSQRLITALKFYRHSQIATIDLFNIARLKPYARNGLIDVLLVCGAIAFTVLQALDATFRADNFYNVFIVAIPAIAVLFVLPVYGIHKRIQNEKSRQLCSIQTLIDNAPRSLEKTDIDHLEVLLQRKERVLDAPSWPIDLSMLYRLFFYGVIPPLAWIAAAFVEIYLESNLSG